MFHFSDINYENIYEIDMSDNFISKIPLNLNFDQLTNLNLSKNRIYNFHENFHENFPNLQILDFSFNQISEIPENMKFNFLQTLRLSYNPLKSLPKILNGPCLETIELIDCRISYSDEVVHEWILAKNWKINISKNRLKRLPIFKIGNDATGCLIVSNNFMTNLDLSGIASIALLDCSENAIQKVHGISKNLRVLLLGKNAITQPSNLPQSGTLELLDITDNPILSYKGFLEDLKFKFPCAEILTGVTESSLQSSPKLSAVVLVEERLKFAKRPKRAVAAEQGNIKVTVLDDSSPGERAGLTFRDILSRETLEIENSSKVFISEEFHNSLTRSKSISFQKSPRTPESFISQGSIPERLKLPDRLKILSSEKVSISERSCIPGIKPSLQKPVCWTIEAPKTSNRVCKIPCAPLPAALLAASSGNFEPLRLVNFIFSEPPDHSEYVPVDKKSAEFIRLRQVISGEDGSLYLSKDNAPDGWVSNGVSCRIRLIRAVRNLARPKIISLATKFKNEFERNKHPNLKTLLFMGGDLRRIFTEGFSEFPSPIFLSEDINTATYLSNECSNDSTTSRRERVIVCAFLPGKELTLNLPLSVATKHENVPWTDIFADGYDSVYFPSEKVHALLNPASHRLLCAYLADFQRISF